MLTYGQISIPIIFKKNLHYPLKEGKEEWINSWMLIRVRIILSFLFWKGKIAGKIIKISKQENYFCKYAVLCKSAKNFVNCQF